jgi:hypothetical protein
MEAYELLKKLEMVKAPSDFEQNLMAQLSLRKKTPGRSKTWSLSLAGAFAGVLVMVLIVNLFLLPGRGPDPYAAGEPGVFAGLDNGERLQPDDTIPIVEAVDYSSEIRSLSNEVPTVYILEQVSWTTDTKIRY